MNEKYFNECANANDLRTRYDEIVRVFNLHAMPDGAFKSEVEEEFNAKMESFTRLPFQSESGAEKHSLEQIEQWIKSNKLKAEKIGRWIWVSSQGINGRNDEMKRLGFRFSQSKQCYYWRSPEDRSNNPNPKPLEEIRRRYGSQAVGITG